MAVNIAKNNHKYPQIAVKNRKKPTAFAVGPMNPPGFRKLCRCARSESLIGRESDAVQFAVLRIKVGHGAVLGRSVVPHGQ
jgi:hypothetical protein